MTRVTALKYGLVVVALACMVLIPAVSAFCNDIPAGTPVRINLAGTDGPGSIASDDNPPALVLIGAETCPFEDIGFCMDQLALTGTLCPGDAFAYPGGQAAVLAPQLQAFAAPSAQSPLAPFSPAAQPGGQVAVEFGARSGSDFTFHESQSADGEINSFSYQGAFTSG